MEVESGETMPRWRVIFEVASTVAMLGLASAVLWMMWQGHRARLDRASADASLQMAVPIEPVDIEGSAALGVPSATVAIIEYADAKCPACRHFARTVAPTLRQDYVQTGRVLFVFKNLPLTSHPEARGIAEAMWCAGRQGRFWQLHDNLFAAPPGDVDLVQTAREVGVNAARFEACRSGGLAAQQVRTEEEEGKTLKVPATPTFLFGRIDRDGRVRVAETMVGGRSIEAFRTILDRLLKT